LHSVTMLKDSKKIAAEFLKKNFRFDTRHNLRNNLDLMKGLSKLKIKSNDKPIYLDVINMFRNILPLYEVLRVNS